MLNPKADYTRDKDIMECKSDGKKEDEIEQALASLSTQETGQSHLILKDGGRRNEGCVLVPGML
jgi:hypothetical protein